MDKRNIEAIYPLSSMQSAFLFHGVDRGNLDPGQLQMRVGFEGELDRAAFSAAWQWLVQRHAVLRTTIHWQDLENPLQVVQRQLNFDVRFEKFLDVDEFFHRDRSIPLDLGRAPVQRVTVISTSTGHHTMCWSCHHILLDGWSAAIILQQLMACYRSIIHHRDYQPEPVVPYQKWLQHIAGLDETATRDFWIQELHAVDSDTRLWVAPTGSSEFNSVALSLDRDLSVQIYQKMQALKTTMGLLLQLVWAVILAQVKQSDDVLFGITVSGRSAGLPGIESMVGLFVNSLPIRVRLAENRPVRDLLRTFKETARRRAGHDHVSLADLHRWSCISGQHPFDSLLVIENFPWSEDKTEQASLYMSSFKGDITNHYPLTLVVMPGECIQMNLHYMDTMINQSGAAKLLARVQGLLRAIVDDPEIQVGQLKQLWSTHIPFRVALATKPEPVASPRHQLLHLLHRDKQPVSIATNDALLNVWRSTLRIQEIGIHDNFFELGGNSFLGLLLLDRINRLVGKQLPLVTIFQAPTIHEMATLLAQGFGRLPETRLIPIRREGNRVPFFMIHGGNFMASILASHLDAQQPFYILDSHWDYGDIGLDETVANLAVAYIKDMQSIQPQGPWLIGGYSMGAVFVYEMAQQLQARGEQVGLLFLLDPPTLPEVFESIESLPESRFTDTKFAADPLAKPAANVQGKSVYVQLKVHIKSRIVRPVKLSIANGYYRCGRLIPVSLRGDYVMHAYRLACKRYKPQPYNGNMVVFSGDNYPACSIWDHLATQENKLVKFDGDHLEFTHNPELIHQWASEFIKFIDD